MKTRIDWNRTTGNNLCRLKHASGYFLIFTGKWMVWIGAFLHEFGKRLAPYSRHQK